MSSNSSVDVPSYETFADGWRPSTVVEANRALITYYWAEAWNRAHYQILVSIFTDPLTIHFHDRTVAVTPPEHQALIEQWHRGIPDLKVSVEDAIAEGDRVAIRTRMTGTHSGEFAGLDATGERISMTGIYISRIDSGKIAERWDEYDLAGVIRRLRESAGFPARRTWDGA